ncbi:hypothetical protein [Flammeovirga sp. SJP92]|uniref:hypothetical protein n=1 Tax=Flammeovirga sp. SJP92 TaxID=1775430 RepID=UPI0007881F07|nr:hypothetical protein [Flammeovirga sp. SJP92]KXX71927.1 hypothetical protein AVL50_03840 [Flammeovirga sp. SJP92]
MVFQNKLLSIGMIISLLFSSCAQEEIQTTSENLPTLKLESTEFLRGNSTLSITTEKRDSMSIHNIILSVNGKTLDHVSKLENDQWKVTFDSKQLEDGFQDITFEALLSSEFALPQTSVKQSFEIEVDNYIEPYFVKEGLIDSLNYDNGGISKSNAEETVIFLDQDQNLIGEPLYLNNFSGNVKILIPENNRDRTFYSGKASSHRLTFYNYPNNIHFEEAAVIRYSKVQSNSTIIKDYYTSINFDKEYDTKSVTIGFPTDLDRYLVKNYDHINNSVVMNEDNDMKYISFKININESSTYPNAFRAYHFSLEKSIHILTELMNDGDTIIFNKEDILNQPDEDEINYPKPNESQSIRYFQILELEEKQFIRYSNTYEYVGDKVLEKFTSTYFNAPSIKIKYLVEKRNIEEDGISEKETIIDKITDSYDEPYPLNYIKYTHNQGSVSVLPNDVLEGKYYKQATIDYSFTQKNNQYRSYQAVSNNQQNEFVFDFSKIDNSFLTAHGGKFKVLFEKPIQFKEFSYLSLTDATFQNRFYMRKKVYENSNTRMTIDHSNAERSLSNRYDDFDKPIQ